MNIRRHPANQSFLLSYATRCIAALLFTIGATGSAYGLDKHDTSGLLAFRVGKVITMNDDDAVINNAVVLVRDGKIEAIGTQADVAVPDGYQVVQAMDQWLVPGLVDAHNHTAGSLMDLNDMVYLTNPGLRTLETVVPESEMVKQGRSGGVTSVLLIPGSGTNMAGFGTLTKMAGDTVDDMVIRSPGSLKIAQAGNPEGYWFGVGRSYMNYNTRQTLQKAKAYHEAWVAHEKDNSVAPPEFNPFFHDFRGLFRHEFVISVHTQIYQVVMTTVDMLSRKMGLRAVLDHSTFDGYKVAPQVLEQDMYTINGPRQYFFDRSERRMYGNASRWWLNGVHKLGINTDAPVVPQEELSYQAAMACWYGWLPYPALRGVTRVPAEALLIDDQVGSIEVGKDADFGIWTGDPIDPRSSCKYTVIDGKIVYDASVERRF